MDSEQNRLEDVLMQGAVERKKYILRILSERKEELGRQSMIMLRCRLRIAGLKKEIKGLREKVEYC